MKEIASCDLPGCLPTYINDLSDIVSYLFYFVVAVFVFQFRLRQTLASNRG